MPVFIKLWKEKDWGIPTDKAQDSIFESKRVIRREIYEFFH
jgi:hypothetical protein